MASILEGKDAVSTAQACAAVPALIEQLREKRRNTAQIDSMNPSLIVKSGTEQLQRLKAVRVRGDLITVKKRDITDYFFASVKSMR